jgi:signal transduction histidine kinase
VGPRVRVILVVVLSLLAVAALAVPLALSLADRRTAALAAERDRQLAALADAAAIPDAPLQRLVDRYHEVYGEDLLIVDSDGRTLAARGLDIAEPDVATAANRALVDAPAPEWTAIRPWDRRQLLAAAGVRREGEPIGAVVLAIDTTVAARDVTNGWLWVAVGCLGLLILAVVAFNTMAQVVRASLDRQRRLVADASHQLRNPLAAVRLRADTLEDYVAEAGWPTYSSMTAELDRFENLLQQLLRLARAEQVSGSRKVGLSTTAAESADLADVIEERVSFWQPILDGEDQQLRNHSDHPGPVVQLARHDVEQLLDVALENALRYAGQGATVTVSTEQTGDTVELIVSDNGVGLPDEDLSRAAARFWRGKDDGAGTGLGLAIAAEIAAGHGGTISVEKAPEGGLLIRYRLPAASESP